MPTNPPKVWLFVPCLIDQFFPQVAIDTWNVLTHCGFEVYYPSDQTCCGQPAFNTGYAREASHVARHFLKVFQSAELVVCPSGSCVSMVRNHYHDLPLSGEEKKILEGFKPKLLEFSEFILKYVPPQRLKGRFPHRVVVHDGCHQLRELGIDDEIRDLLRSIDEIELLAIPHDRRECCGFGGTFSILFPALSTEMAVEQVSQYRELEAEYLVSTDISCLMQLGGIIRRQGIDLTPLHLASLMAMALDNMT